MVAKEKTMKKPENVQPEVNIGMVGHVDHGKTTLLKRLSGRWTDTHSEESKRGITIKLGYADTSIYKTTKGFSGKKESEKDKLLRVVSFVDAPGHETLMATMLSGAAIMDGALLLVAANEDCPQPQTKEHLMALEIIGVKNIIIIQNKIDLVSQEDALKNYKSIKNFVKGTVAEKAPIIPISAVHNVNIDAVFEAIEEFIPTPKRDPDKEPLLFVARSFDINKPGTSIKKLVGGVFGGSLKQGILKVGDKLAVCPGRLITEKGMEKWISVETEIVGLKTGGASVDAVHPGGSVAVLTLLDPSIVKSDQFSGALVGPPGSLPELWTELKFEPKLLKRVVGAKDELAVEPIKKGEPLMLNVNSSTTAGVVVSLEKKKIHLRLKRPVCAEKGSKIAISRRVGTRWRLIGTAEVGN